MALRALMLLWLTSLIYLSSGDQPVEEELITPKHVQPSGGAYPMNPQSDEIMEVARKAVEEFNKRCKATRSFKLLNVTSAEAQVTHLITYRIEAEVIKTKCLKSAGADPESCAIGNKQKLKMCRFEVAFTPQDGRYELLQSFCKR